QPRRRSANQRAIESVLSPSVREQKNENPRPNPPIRGRRSPPTDGCGVTTHMWIKASLVSVSLALAGVDNLSVGPEVKPSDVQFGNTTVNWKQRTLRFLARKQEGSLKGHNPRRHGRPSHHRARGSALPPPRPAAQRQLRNRTWGGGISQRSSCTVGTAPEDPPAES